MAVKWKPFTIILLDKIEKAHPDIFKPQALKNGHHFDFQDQRVYFKNTSIIMTFNVRSTTNAKIGSNEGPQLFIHGIQKMIWKTNNYKLYCLKNTPLKKKGLKHTSPGSHLEKGTNPRYTSQVSASTQIQYKVDISKINFEEKATINRGDNVT